MLTDRILSEPRVPVEVWANVTVPQIEAPPMYSDQVVLVLAGIDPSEP